ncbi:MAG: hypothetical protein U5K00_05120 [Melioribacteraceae bacterium]|nr:hypothetical protein [Melioribacteraceae bacterium]
MGNPNWRDIWKEKNYSQKDFIRFLADEYDKSNGISWLFTSPKTRNQNSK